MVFCKSKKIVHLDMHSVEKFAGNFVLFSANQTLNELAKDLFSLCGVPLFIIAVLS